MTMRRRARNGVAGMATLGCLVAGALVPLTAAPAAAAPADLTITPNPWYQGQEFEGWGTSLVWFANATGDYPAELREDLYQKVFGEDGLDLNIARYNIGGGNASDVTDYLRAGGAVDGYWAPDADGSKNLYDGATTNYADRENVLDAWDPTDETNYDWNADATQRWWVERLAADDQISHWETFANSAPYFMTESGYVSGGFDSTDEQLKPEADEKFVAYLTRVTEHLEDEYGITVDTLDPFNEPNTDYWGTTIRNGQPTGRQEGMHVGPQRQVDVTRALAAELDKPETTTDTGIAVMDETNPGIFQRNWAAYPQDARDLVSQLNVHTYGTSGRLGVRDLAKQADLPLWMSEIEGNWVSGWDPGNIENGLGIASRVMDDLRELEPKAWVLWQPVEDLYNMDQPAPRGENLNWGSIYIDFDCKPYTENGVEVWKSERRVADAGGNSAAVAPCSVKTNTKFQALRNFTKFIHEGDRLIATDDVNSTAAVKSDGSGATLVHRNTSTDAKTVSLDLSNFGEVAAGATVTGYVTDATNALAAWTPVAIDPTTKSATVTVPAKSITTFEISDVSGVAAEAPAVRDDTDYTLVGVQSGKPLTAATTNTVITSAATTPQGATAQKWTAHEVPAGDLDSTRRVVLENGDGRILGATSSGTDLRGVTVDAAKADAATRWIVNSTDGKTFTFVNEALAQSLDVAGQSSADNTTVGVYGSNGGANQAWTVRDLTPAEGQEVAVRTTAGVAPSLPSTVAARYSWGTGGAASVIWENVDAAVWQNAGQVRVAGVATDLYGQQFPVTAVVDVGGLTITDPVSVTIVEGAAVVTVAPQTPTTVPARVGASSNTFEIPVTWDLSGLEASDLATAGTVTTFPGVADDNGTRLSATLSVIVSAPVGENFATEDGIVASASSTEGGYPADRTRNGNFTDKGWSNWVPNNKPTQSTLTYTFDSVRDAMGSKVHFFDDGQTWAQSIQFELLGEDGVWRAAPGYENAVATGTQYVTATWDRQPAAGLRVVMNAYPNRHLVVSEVEIYGPAAGPASVNTLAALRLDGTSVDQFSSNTEEYDATVRGSRFPTLTAIATDSAATVTVDPATEENGGVATIRVVSADGENESTYTIGIERRVAVTTVVVGGEPVVGRQVSAVVATDPVDVELAYEWLLNGVAVTGADAPTFTVPADAEGKTLSVRVAATAEGFLAAEAATSAEVTVLAAPVVTPPSGDGDGGTQPGGPTIPVGNGGSGATGNLARSGFDAGLLPLIALLALLGGAGALIGTRRVRSARR